MASVQEHRTPQIPTKLVGGKIPSDDDKRALLDNIKAMVPDHQARLMKLEVRHLSCQKYYILKILNGGLYHRCFFHTDGLFIINNNTRSPSFLRENIVIVIVDKPTVLNKRLWLVSVVQRKMRFIIGE